MSGGVWFILPSCQPLCTWGPPRRTCALNGTTQGAVETNQLFLKSVKTTLKAVLFLDVS